MNQMQDGQLLAEQAQEALWDALRNGTLRDGQFLSMSQLVEILEFPLAATREAVKQACSQGLLTTWPKRGVQVMEAHALKRSVTVSTFGWCLIRKAHAGGFSRAT